MSVAGRTLKSAPVIREIVAPGEISIAVTAANSAPFQRTETVAAGKTVTVEVPAMGDAGGAGSQEPPSVAQPVSARKKRLMIAYGVGGAGVVTLGVSVFVALKAKSNYNAQFDNGNCMDTGDRPTCNAAGFNAQNDAVSLANVGTVIGVVGIAALGAGAALYLTAPKDVMVTPTATAQSAGLAVVGRF